LVLSKVVGGVTTILKSFDAVATFIANEYYWLKFQVQGTDPTTLSGKLWPAVIEEPNWQLSDQDTAAVLQAAGQVGVSSEMYPQVTNEPITINFDELTGVSL
jgi:hypothetical protein